MEIMTSPKVGVVGGYQVRVMSLVSVMEKIAVEGDRCRKDDEARETPSERRHRRVSDRLEDLSLPDADAGEALSEETQPPV